VPTASGANTFLTNPLGCAYANETNVPLYGRLDASRERINPRFIIVNNNWADAGQAGREGELYVDGICIEHHAFSEDFNRLRPAPTLGPFPRVA
jgi:hypothetical protein